MLGNRFHRAWNGGWRVAPAAVVASCAIFATARGEDIFDLDPIVIEERDSRLAPGVLAPASGTSSHTFTATDEIADTPGLSISRRGTFSVEPVIRGLGHDRVKTRLNGLAIPNGSPTWTQAPLNLLAWTGPEGWKITAALPSLADGPPATGGAIDIGLDPSYQGLTAGSPADAGTISGLVNPSRSGKLVAAEYTLRSRQASGRVAALSMDVGNFTSGDGRSVPSSSRHYGTDMRVSFHPHGRWSHAVNGLYMRQGFTDNASLPLDTQTGSIAAFTGLHMLDAGEADAYAFRLRYGYARSSATLDNGRRPDAPVRVETRTRTDSFHLDGAWNYAGFDFGISSDMESREAVRYRGTGGRDEIWPDILYRNTGAFLQYHAALTDVLTIRSGLRWDDSTNEARAADQTAFGWKIRDLYQEFSDKNLIDPVANDSCLSANVFLQWNATPSISLYAGAGTSEQAAMPTERYRAFLQALGGGFEIGNPGLDPERKLEFITGGLFQAGCLAMRIDAYHFRIKDFIWRQQVGTTEGILELPEPQPLYSYRNTECSFTGLELQGSWQLGETLQLPFSIEWISARLEKSGPGHVPGDSIPGLPPAAASAGLRWNWKAGRISGSLHWSLRWTDHAANPLPSVDPLYSQSPSYALQSLYGSIVLPGGMELGLQLRNLFDKQYAPYLAPPVSSLAPSSGGLLPGDRIPGPGREVILSLQIKF